MGFVIAEVGFAPSSALGWVLFAVFGPAGYFLAEALGEVVMTRLDSGTKQLGGGSAGRIALLALVSVPILALAVYLTNK